MRYRMKPQGSRLRRGIAVVYVAISMTVVMGMAALSVDIGMLYNAQAELQRAADSAALAAAAELVAEGGASPEQLARDAADEFARLNTILRESVGDGGAQIEFGRAVYNAGNGRFEFDPTGEVSDAVRVTVSRDSSASAGPIEMLFAGIFGMKTRALSARAAAVLVPRDIAVVIDLSGSMNYDSQLRYANRGDGGYANTYDIWAALDGPEPSRPYEPAPEGETEYAGDSGPAFGLMDTWGSPLEPGVYNALADPGLFYIRKSYNTSNATISSSLSSRGYSNDERSILMSGSRDSNSSHWKNRIGVMLGLATWRSGRSGGLYPYGGDGDSYIENGEITWIPTPSFEVSWNWTDYINWVHSNATYSGGGVPFRWRYGLKTFVDFLLDSERQYDQTDILWATPEQPLQAVKDAVLTMTDVISSLQSLDHVSLEIFATTSRHEVDLTDDLYLVPNTLYQRQAAHYDGTTNIASGISRAIAELQSARSRPAAKKIIILMSDGVPNTDEDGSYIGENDTAKEYARQRAEQAADLGMTLYTVSVGYGVDRDLMIELAEIGRGQEFYAAGTPEEYADELEAIFRSLGGKRPVALIE